MWKKIVGWVGLVLLAPVVGLVAFFASAKLTSSVAGLLAFALVAELLAAFGFARLASPRRSAIVASIATALFATFFCAIFFRATPKFSASMPPRGATFEPWTLSTGSRVAVARFGAGQSTPIVYLHGGPGAPVLAEDVAFFQALSREHFDVVVFDQAGVGESSPLPPNEITVERAVADLDALRDKLGAEKISLVGVSWGGRLAYEYAVQHRDRVERMVLVSPGPIARDRKLWEFDLHRTAARSEGVPLQLLASVILYAINPDAALHYRSREQLNQLVADMVPALTRRVVCTNANIPSVTPAGVDAVQMLALRRYIENHAPPDLSPPPPSLILRGECDYLKWASSRDYRDRLHATLIYVPGAGHMIWPPKQDLALAAMKAFFRGEPLGGYTGDLDPAGD